MQASQTAHIKQIAKELGFDFCGISKAAFLEQEASRLEDWLKKGMHGDMKYMENYFDLRLDPTKLVPDSKSVISLLINYFPDKKQAIDAPKVSKYAYGTDYHVVIKQKMKEMVFRMQEKLGNFNARVFVDSAPVLDKTWAQKAGLGWMGKHTNIIYPQKGSFFFLAEIICDLHLEYDHPIKDYCGTCTRCIDACPTDAIVEPYQVDGSKCISYLTIELKNAIPEGFKDQFKDWVFGCDICQDVCPWNRFSKPHQEPLFNPSEEFLNMRRKDWLEITQDVFASVFRDSAIQRTKFSGIVRNLNFIEPKD